MMTLHGIARMLSRPLQSIVYCCRLLKQLTSCRTALLSYVIQSHWALWLSNFDKRSKVTFKLGTTAQQAWGQFPTPVRTSADVILQGRCHQRSNCAKPGRQQKASSCQLSNCQAAAMPCCVGLTGWEQLQHWLYHLISKLLWTQDICTAYTGVWKLLATLAKQLLQPTVWQALTQRWLYHLPIGRNI